MSYFDFYFNIAGDKSLRSYSLPLDLTIYISHKWAITDEDLEYIGDKLESMRHFPVVDETSMFPKTQTRMNIIWRFHPTIKNKLYTDETMIKNLYRASDIMLKAGMLGSNDAGYSSQKATEGRINPVNTCLSEHVV